MADTLPIRIRAALAVVRDGAILLVPHHQTDAASVQWNLPGGSVAFGESLHQAALREFTEETGLQARIDTLLDVTEVILPERPWHSITVTFSGTLIGGTERSEPGHLYGDKPPRWFTAAQLATIAYHPREPVDKALHEKPGQPKPA